MQSTTLIFKHFVDQCLWINAKFELKCRGFYMNDKRWCIVWTHLNFHSKTLQEWFRFCVVLGVFRGKVRFLESNGHFELKYAYCSFIEELNIKTLGAEINEFSATSWKSRSLRWTQMLKFDMKQHQMEIQWNWECNENQNAMKFKMLWTSKCIAFSCNFEFMKFCRRANIPCKLIVHLNCVQFQFSIDKLKIGQKNLKSVNMALPLSRHKTESSSKTNNKHPKMLKMEHAILTWNCWLW